MPYDVNLSWVKGLLPGQPQWVWETVAQEITRLDNRITRRTELLIAAREQLAGDVGKQIDAELRRQD